MIERFAQRVRLARGNLQIPDFCKRLGAGSVRRGNAISELGYTRTSMLFRHYRVLAQAGRGQRYFQSARRRNRRCELNEQNKTATHENCARSSAHSQRPASRQFQERVYVAFDTTMQTDEMGETGDRFGRRWAYIPGSGVSVRACAAVSGHGARGIPLLRRIPLRG